MGVHPYVLTMYLLARQDNAPGTQSLHLVHVFLRVEEQGCRASLRQDSRTGAAQSVVQVWGGRLHIHRHGSSGDEERLDHDGFRIDAAEAITAA